MALDVISWKLARESENAVGRGERRVSVMIVGRRFCRIALYIL